MKSRLKPHNYKKVKVAGHFQKKQNNYAILAAILFFPLMSLGIKYYLSEHDLISPCPSWGCTIVSAHYEPKMEDIEASKWIQFRVAVERVAPMYKFPVNVVLAQGALESAHGTSDFAIHRNNFLGIGAFDSNPDNAFTYETPEMCVIAYMQTIKKTFPKAWSLRDKPEELLKALKSEKKQYASDPAYVNKVMSLPEWKE